MFRKFIFIVFILASFHVNVNSQCTQQWVHRYNGPGNNTDEASSIAMDAFGNFYVTGRSYGSGTFGDYATIKYNPAGDTVWTAKYNSPGNYNDYAEAIALDTSGNVYVTGYCQYSGSVVHISTIKYNSLGVQQWVQLYEDIGGQCYAYDMEVDKSGNVYVTGKGTNVGFDILTIKYNTSGVQQWLARYIGNPVSYKNEYASAVAVDNLGNVYISGRSVETTADSYNFITIKYNSAGVQQWVRLYKGTLINNTYDAATDMKLDISGNVYVTGYSYGTYNDILTIKYNSAGDTLWIARYNGPGNRDDYAYALAVDNSGNVYVTGESFSSTSNNSNDYATIKYNSSGIQQWVSIYNGPKNSYDYAKAIAIDNSGNSYITGYSYGTGSSYGNADYATIKYNPSGVQQWVQRYNELGNSLDEANAIVVDNAGNICVTGYSYSGSGSSTSDYATIKYSSPTGLPQNNELPTSYLLHQNYPNPFNPSTIINYQIPIKSNVKLAVYDVLGREAALLVNENKKAGSYKIEWNAAYYPSGVYFYKISANGFNETRKMILVK